MQAASRASLAEARERLRAIAGGAGTGRREVLAADLRGVAALLGREPGLRRALADPSRGDDVRTGLLDALLGERIGADAADVLRTVVSARWSGPGEFVDAVELLAVDAELADAAASDSLIEVEDQLFRFGRIVSGTPALSAILNDASVDLGRRAALVGDLLGDSVTPVAARLVVMAVHGVGGRGFDGSMQRITELVASRRDREIAYVRVAAPLSADQEDRIGARLATLYGRQISLKVEVDPRLIGGATIRIGDDLFDGSVARRLEQARSALTTSR